jgi:hypothetical protein
MELHVDLIVKPYGNYKEHLRKACLLHQGVQDHFQFRYIYVGVDSG